MVYLFKVGVALGKANFFDETKQLFFFFFLTRSMNSEKPDQAVFQSFWLLKDCVLS